MPDFSVLRKITGNYYMFNIIRRPGKIHLDCFTYQPSIADLFPIEYARKVLPDWYKKLPTTVKWQGPSRGTMKTCPGVADLFRKGFIIPAWREFYVEVVNGVPRTEPVEEFGHVKLICPWRIREKTGVQFIWTQPFWQHNTTRYVTPTGLVEYKYQHTTNVNMLVPKKLYPNNFTIDAGEPLAHVMPMSDKEIVLHHHVIDGMEWQLKHSTYAFTFSGQYYKFKKLMQDKGK
jgi:hypothetical protein